MNPRLLLCLMLPAALLAQQPSNPHAGRVMGIGDENKPMTAAQREKARREREQRLARVEALKKQEAERLAKSYAEGKARREANAPKVQYLVTPGENTGPKVVTNKISQVGSNAMAKTNQEVVDAINMNRVSFSSTTKRFLMPGRYKEIWSWRASRLDGCLMTIVQTYNTCDEDEEPDPKNNKETEHIINLETAEIKADTEIKNRIIFKQNGREFPMRTDNRDFVVDKLLEYQTELKKRTK